MTGQEKGDIYIQVTAKIEVTAWAVLAVFRQITEMYLNSIKEWVVRKAKHSKYLRRENSPKQLKYIKQNFHESEYVGIYNVSDQK